MTGIQTGSGFKILANFMANVFTCGWKSYYSITGHENCIPFWTIKMVHYICALVRITSQETESTSKKCKCDQTKLNGLLLQRKLVLFFENVSSLLAYLDHWSDMSVGFHCINPLKAGLCLKITCLCNVSFSQVKRQKCSQIESRGKKLVLCWSLFPWLR